LWQINTSGGETLGNAEAVPECQVVEHRLHELETFDVPMADPIVANSKSEGDVPSTPGFLHYCSI